MARYWTTYWKNSLWRDDVNPELGPFELSGSNVYRKRGVLPGDTVFVVSVCDGQLHLGGRMTVHEIVSREAAIRLAGSDTIYDASDWIVARVASGTPLALCRRLDPDVTRRLRFLSPSGATGLVFKAETHLDEQTLRGVRELSEGSARMLNQIIDVTDRAYQAGVTLHVTMSTLQSRS